MNLAVYGIRLACTVMYKKYIIGVITWLFRKLKDKYKSSLFTWPYFVTHLFASDECYDRQRNRLSSSLQHVFT